MKTIRLSQNLGDLFILLYILFILMNSVRQNQKDNDHFPLNQHQTLMYVTEMNYILSIEGFLKNAQNI